MPKKNIDYSRSIVYKICCNDIAIKDCYVGSTTSLVKRRYAHKNSCVNEKDKRRYNLNVYKFIRANGGFDNWSVVMIQEYPECKSQEELLKHERHHFEILGATLNSCVPARTNKEYQREHKEHYVEQRKKRYENNKEQMCIDARQHYYENKEYIIAQKKERIICERCGLETSRGDISRHQKSKACLATQTD
jgi:RNA:NAD 2'-phosphotransferase (TPT1/KptA family)